MGKLNIKTLIEQGRRKNINKICLTQTDFISEIEKNNSFKHNLFILDESDLMIQKNKIIKKLTNKK